jgi:hypothetical protein
MSALRHRHMLAGLLCLALGSLPTLAAEAQPDTVVVHSISAGKQLGDLLRGIASVAKGAFTLEAAEGIQREIWKASAGTEVSYRSQIVKSYAFLVLPREDHQAVLTFSMLSTRNYLVDLTIVSTPLVMGLIRSSLRPLDIDSLVPFDRGWLTLTEERTPEAEPRPLLTLKTRREFRCLGYYIDHDLSQGRDTITLNLHGVSPPTGPCPAMVGPAQLGRKLDTSNTKVILLVRYRDKTDRLVLNISDTGTVVLGLDSSLVEADERPRWRYPRKSFAFHCSNIHVARAICDDVEHWLAQEPGISPISLPTGWINPYDPDPASFPDRSTSLFRYDSEKAFERLRLCLGAIGNQLRGTKGVDLMLEDSRGAYISAGSRWGNPAELPTRVTRTPACRTPRWMYQPRDER